MIKVIGKPLSQWDLERSVRIVTEDGQVITEVDFAARGDISGLTVEAAQDGDGYVAKIPNIYLQNNKDIMAHAVYAEGETRVTVESRALPVQERERPAGYVYTETQVFSVYSVVDNALMEAKERGDFKGDPGEKGEKGDKGDAGVINFVVVAELPEVGSGDSIYLMPTADSPEGNLFDEYIYVDGKPEKIGSATVQVDLSEYVKNTDYANIGVAGVVKLGSTSGIRVQSTDQCIYLDTPNESEITNKSTGVNAPLKPRNIDSAVKVGVTTNTIDLTEDEQKAACGWLGVDTLIDEKLSAIPFAEEAEF